MTTTPLRGAVDLDALTAFQYGEIRRRIGRATRVGGSDLDELVHTVLERLYGSSAVFACDEHLYAYVITAARRLRINEARRRLTVPLDDLSEAEFGPAPDPGDIVAARADYDGVLMALRGIGPRQREALWLHHVEERTRAEVATVLGITESALNVALHRARLSLRRVLGRTAAVVALVRPRRVHVRHVIQPAAGVSAVMVLLTGPLGVGAAVPPRAERVLNTGQDAVTAPRAASPGASRARQGGRIARAEQQPPTARHGDAGASPDRLPPVPQARVEVCARGTQHVCTGTGPRGEVPRRRGDTLYVAIPAPVGGEEGSEFYVNQATVPACEHIPATPLARCVHEEDPPELEALP